jgi:TetR/AcrR family transcriptional regulator, cholesterol catabolism regulator
MAIAATGVGRKEQLVDQATLLFSRQGYHGTSMRDIAEAVGMLPGSLYFHIRTKEDLLYEIVLRAAGEFLDDVTAAAASIERPEDRLRAAMRAHVRVVAGDVEAARVFHHEWTMLTGERRQEIVELRDRYENLWDGIIGGLPGRVPRKLARLLVLSAANWVYTWYDPAGALTPDQIADGFTDILLKGLTEAGRGKTSTKG